jgi:hypothetical protein
MAQRKETKKIIKVRDLKPKKDAKGGFVMSGQSPKQQQTGGGKQMSRIWGP